MEKSNVLGLFDGMCGGGLSFDKIGVLGDINYFASEVDKFAVAESSANFPNIIHLGDVKHVRRALCWSEKMINRALNAPWVTQETKDNFKKALVVRGVRFDMVLGGSPCQGFSFAGKQLAFNDPRSKLFFEYVKIVNKVKEQNPEAEFFLENVKMKKQHMDVITDFVKVEPIFVNSALVSAQNRQRYYWTNFNWSEGTPTFNDWYLDTKEYGGSRKEYDELYPAHILQPDDKGVVLADILERNPDAKWNHTDKAIEYMDRQVNGGRTHWDFKHHHDSNSEKSMAITANIHKGVPYNMLIDRVSGCAYNRNDGIGKELDKAYALNASDWRGLNRNQNQTAIVRSAAVVGRRINPATMKRDDYNKDIPITQTLEVQDSDKSRCLSTVEKDCMVSTEKPGRYLDAYNRNDIKYRKLTIIECCRLQTVPDDYFKVSSNTQAYKMLGNGWTIDVIVHFLMQSKLVKRLLAKKK